MRWNNAITKRQHSAVSQEGLKLLTQVLLCSLIGAVFITSTAAPRAIVSPPSDQSPEVTVQEFYKWYVHSLSHQIDPFKAGRATLQKYVTLRLIRKTERIAKEMEAAGLDGDYFLEAQRDYPASADLEAEWTKNISISKSVVKGTTATAVISFGENGVLAKERVSLVQEGGAWKIDDVKSINALPR